MASECPKCGESFETKQGMRSHYSQKHGKKDWRKETECANCEDTIKRHEREFERSEKFFCSTECESEYKQESLKGENNPCWRGGINSVEFECDWCGDTSTARKSRLEQYENNFCNSECRGEWHRESGLTLGKNNTEWIDGRTWQQRKASGYKWEENRNKALENADFRCSNCDRTEKEINGYLNVHHIIPFEEFDTTKEANKLKNLKVLCPKCHTSLHN